MSTDYKSTVFLPKTDFPMKAGLPELEARLLERWASIDLFGQLRQQSKGREKFVLHDGPPYANGNLHIGHALNKILKDIVVRTQQMSGKDANYVPGWDCHGLPIEWKIEERYLADGKNKDDVDRITFRRECREFAAHWIDVQRGEFKRLGIIGDWNHPYATMEFHAEARIVAELWKFVLNEGLYRGTKPVLWSVVEKTALAEAELEYHDHTSTAIWVRFPMIASDDPARAPDLADASVVIWTTTPWTMPANRAIAFHPDLDYRIYRVDAAAEGSLARVGEKLVLAEARAADVMASAKFTASPISGPVRLDTLRARHPLASHPDAKGGYGFQVPILPADFVTSDTGTGFVHIAPGHGDDDWKLGTAHGIEVAETVLPDGTYAVSVPMFAGLSVLAQGKNGKYYSPAEKPILEALRATGALLHNEKLVHSYPHSWRSHAPLIFRTTAQWFIAMEDKNHLRAKALAAIDATRFVPPQGRNRLRSMIESRPDWCVSRQRAWGVPIAIFVDRRTGLVLRDQAVMARIIQAFEEEGADAWFTSPPERFLGPDHDPADWEQIFDILDVWFESGCTHAFVLEEDRWGLSWPASLYLEGSDQHRGWFHSSLLESCGTRGRAPYDLVLTHGFVLDEEGRKMSKSLGNVVAPQEVASRYGADILRLWVTASDYADDLRIGPEIIKTQIDVYRRFRNTLRYLLGALDGFSEAERVPAELMPPLERWVMHRLAELDKAVREACHTYQFHALFAELHNFCAVDLSAFYFDIRKDSLYCDSPNDPRRRAARTLMDIVFDCLVRWLAPFLAFTAEEAWLARHPSDQDSIHLLPFVDVPDSWRNDALAAKWSQVRDVRRVVTGALEIERAAKRIGSGLQAAPDVFLTAAHAEALSGLDLAEIAIVSDVSVQVGDVPEGAFMLDEEVSGVGVVFKPADGGRCDRCWRVLPDVGTHRHEGLCGRCDDALTNLEHAG